MSTFTAPAAHLWLSRKQGVVSQIHLLPLQIMPKQYHMTAKIMQQALLPGKAFDPYHI